VLQRVKEEMSILRTVKLRKANWFGYVLHRECLLTHVTEGNTNDRKMGKKTSVATG